MVTRYALTTVDNPYDPFDEFSQWYEWDHRLGYDTSDYLGRVVQSAPELPDGLENEAISDAIDEIIEEHGTDLYRKISRDFAA